MSMRSIRAPRAPRSADISPPAARLALRSSGRPLEPATRAAMEARFGHDFSRVRVHADAKAADSARAVGALAYTVGRDVVFGAGQYEPGTSQGRRLLAHELAHVIQQDSGPAMFGPPAGGADLHERAAESAAVDVAAGRTAHVSSGSAPFGLQRQPAPGPTPAPGPGLDLEECVKNWEKDPQSMSLVVARHFGIMEIDPTLANKLATTTCTTDHDCTVTFEGGDPVIDVYWYTSNRRVGAGFNGPQGRRFCAFDYSCNANGGLTLTLVKCHGPKP